jgi:hypothetical protein
MRLLTGVKAHREVSVLTIINLYIIYKLIAYINSTVKTSLCHEWC